MSREQAWSTPPHLAKTRVAKERKDSDDPLYQKGRQAAYQEVLKLIKEHELEIHRTGSYEEVA